MGPLAGGAAAAGNASAAAGFIENAQNKDGGFGAQRGQGSDAGASLWATVALLAAGRNPRDERLNNGASADDYVAAHLLAYTSLSNLGLLAIAGGPRWRGAVALSHSGSNRETLLVYCASRNVAPAGDGAHFEALIPALHGRA
jgi:hypothetical protein